MLKKFLTTVAVIVSTSYGAQSEIMDIQDPVFSLEGLGLSSVSSENTQSLDFQGISRRSLSAGLAELDTLFSNLTRTEGELSEPVVNKLTALILALHSEAQIAYKLIGSNVVVENATQDTIGALHNMYYIRIVLLQQCVSRLEKAMNNKTLESVGLFFSLSESLKYLMSIDPTEILKMTIKKGLNNKTLIF